MMGKRNFQCQRLGVLQSQLNSQMQSPEKLLKKRQPCNDITEHKKDTVVKRKKKHLTHFDAPPSLSAAVRKHHSLKDTLRKNQSQIELLRKENAVYQKGLVAAQVEATSLKNQVANAEAGSMFLSEKLAVANKQCDDRKDEADKFKKEMLNARSYLNKAYERIRNVNVMYEGTNPFEAADVLLKELAAKAVPKEQIIDGFLEALCRKPSYRKHLHSAIIQQEDAIPKVIEHYQDVLYESLRAKFKPWICLMELDLAATVSFRGYEVIRNIEFYGSPSKYKRGLFQSRAQLSRAARKLEAYASTVLPHTIAANSIKFDIKIATKWLLQKYGLWRYVEQRERMVTVAATVDGGELAWKLTQILAGVKICDEKAINPLTGERLFGATGYDIVQ
jgi:hypothetical protein